MKQDREVIEKSLKAIVKVNFRTVLIGFNSNV